MNMFIYTKIRIFIYWPIFDIMFYSKTKTKKIPKIIKVGIKNKIK